MREVVENSPQVVGYSCLEGIKCEIQMIILKEHYLM